MFLKLDPDILKKQKRTQCFESGSRYSKKKNTKEHNVSETGSRIQFMKRCIHVFLECQTTDEVQNPNKSEY
jgi:hypothetical protein